MIYRIQPKTLEYMCLHIEGKEARKALGEETDFNIDPSPISYFDQWQTMKVDFYDDAPGANTIPDIAMRVGKLFLSEKSYSVLHKILAPHGEFLPVIYDSGKGYIFNCLDLAETYGAVNESLSMHDPMNDRFSIVFREKLLTGVNIFRSQVDLNGLFCSEEVKEIIVNSKLTGVEFVEDVGHPFPQDAKMQKSH